MNPKTLHDQDRRHGEHRKPSPDGQAERAANHGDGGQSMPMASYTRFAAMVGASTAIGFAAMYLNTYALDHVFFSWTRLFMIMGGVMTAIMMLFMWGMYPSKRANWGVLGVAAALFVAGLALVRTQATVGDVSWMKAMIPHHSIAILTSGRAKIEDPRVRKLADAIIETQRKEIAEMKGLIADLEWR